MAFPGNLSCHLSRSSSFARTSKQIQRLRQKRCCLSRVVSQNGLRYQTACALESIHLQRPVAPTATLHIARLKASLSTSGRRCVSHSSSSTAASALPAYELPTTGVLSYLPATWVPYAELIRLDKPTGTYYLFFPCFFSTLLAAPLTTPITSPSVVLSTSALFFAGALIMRGAGCTINDLWDRNLDPHVARTRLRPIARGAISVRQAIPFLGAQLLAGLGILVALPTQCLYYGIPSLILVGAYPLAKRVTNYPQIVLGLTFSWGAIMGFPALGIDLVSHTSALVSASCLYASCVAWTVVYDMIYAYQDIRDDAAAGIKSIALAQKSNAKAFLTAVATMQVALLAGAGLAINTSPSFFVATCGGAAATLGHMIRKVELESVEDCWRWFKKGAWFTGSAVSLGLLTEYVVQYFGLHEGGRSEEIVRGERI